MTIFVESMVVVVLLFISDVNGDFLVETKAIKLVVIRSGWCGFTMGFEVYLSEIPSVYNGGLVVCDT